MKCEKCDSQKFIQSVLCDEMGSMIVLAPETELGSMNVKRHSRIIVSVCKDCGNVCMIKAETPENL